MFKYDGIWKPSCETRDSFTGAEKNMVETCYVPEKTFQAKNTV